MIIRCTSSFPLSKVKPNSTVNIVEIKKDGLEKALRQKLLDLGFVKDKTIEVQSVSSTQIIVNIADTTYLMDKKIASAISVTKNDIEA